MYMCMPFLQRADGYACALKRRTTSQQQQQQQQVNTRCLSRLFDFFVCLFIFIDYL